MPPRLCAWTLLLAVLGQPAFAAGTPSAQSWYGSAWRQVAQTWEQGGLELYVPIRTYHMPYAYSAALRKTYNDFPAGAGLGAGRYNASGNWEGLFALEFADSHGRPQYNGGFAWIPTWHPFSDDLRVGAGLAGLIIARSDMRRYTPFPGVLPLGSLGLGHVDVQAAFVPGGKNNGNVVLSWLKLSFY